MNPRNYSFLPAAFFVLNIILTASTVSLGERHSPWFLKSSAIRLAGQPLDIVSSTTNATHVFVLDSLCRVATCPYDGNGVSNLDYIPNFASAPLDTRLCGNSWSSWRYNNSATMKWNPISGTLNIWKYVIDFGNLGHRAVLYEFTGANETNKYDLKYTSDFFLVGFRYPSTGLYIDSTAIFGSVFNNVDLDPAGNGGWLIAKFNHDLSTASWIFNSTQPVSAIQFNCNNAGMICVFTKSRTVLEYRLSDLSFQRSYSIDLNSIPFYFNPAIAHVPEESSSLFFHKHPTQPDRFMLQRRNYSGFTIQSSILPFDYSFTYDIPTYDVLKSGTGEIFTGVTTMLNTSIGLGGSDIIITKYSSSLQRISSLVFSTIKNDNMSNIFLSGNDSVLVVGMTEGVLHIPTAETARQIFVAQMLYSDISAVSTSAPNVIMANEMISISFSSVLPSAAYQSIPQVMFGSKNCTEVKWNGTYMMARAPAGVGGPYDLVVLFDYLSYAPSAKTSNFSYGQPILLNVYPTKGPAVGFNITLEADKIGTPGVDQVTVTVGGKRCLEVIYEIANTIKCTCPPGSGVNNSVVISLGPVSNSTELFFISYDEPVILQVQPNVGPTEGQNLITVRGANFGPCSSMGGTCDANSNKIWMKVGGKDCTGIQQVNDTRLQCLVAEGVGFNLPIQLSVNEQISSSDFQYSYSPPVLFRVIPTSAANPNPVVYLEGDNFGAATDSRSVIFKSTNSSTEYICPNVVWSSHKNIRCEFTNVSLPLYSTYDISVGVGGQSNIQSSVAKFRTGIPNSPPTALPYNSTFEEDTLLIAELKAADIDADDSVQIYITSNPINGKLYQMTSSGTRGAQIDSSSSISLVTDASFRVMYIAAPDFYGSDFFYFKAKDRSNAESNLAIANLTIIPIPDPPIPLPDEVQTNEDVPVIFNVRAQFPDGNSNPNNSIVIVSLPGRGQLMCNLQTSSEPAVWFSIEEVPFAFPANATLKFVPTQDGNGLPYTKFVFVATDGVLNSTGNATVTINVIPVNDPPYFNYSVYFNFTVMEDKDEMLIFDIGDVDMDNRLSVKITNIRINGSLFHVDRQSGIRNTVAIGEGSELPGPPFRIVYAPALNYYTRDSSSYQRFNVVVTDLATGGVSFTSEIQFPVIPENDPPTLSCNPQAFDLSPDFLTGVTDFYSIQLTANDFDDSFLQYILSEIPPKGEFYTDKKELIQANSPFNSTSLAYHLKDSGGSYPFPTFTAYAMDSQGAISNNCTFMLTIDCPPGRYNNIFRNNSGAICEFCPEGATCSHDGKLPPQPKYGHWKSDQNFSFLPCIPAQACPGSAEIKCSPGYEGTRCGQCTKGYYRLGDSCLRCTEGNWLPIVIALACIIFFGPVLLLYFHSRWNGPSFAIVGIGINFIQTILILRQLQLDWPPEFHAVANMIMVVNFNIDFTSPECYLFEESLNFSTRMKLSLVIPLALIGFIAIAIWIRWIALVVHRMYTSSSITTTNGSRFLQFVRVVNVLLTFVYMSVATHSLALFDCTQESDGRIYLDADPSLRCYEDWWYNDRLYAVPAVCVYVVGIPAYFSFMSYAIYQTKYKRTFWLKSKEIAKQIVHRDSSFKPEYQFFIVLQLCQKLLLVMFSMFLTRYIGLQIILNLAVLQISFLSILKYKPYKYNSLNLLEVLSHVSAMAILSFGLPFHVDKSTTDGYKSSLMLFILIIIFGFIFILLCVLVYELHQRIRMRGSNPKGSEKAGHQNPKLLR